MLGGAFDFISAAVRATNFGLRNIHSVNLRAVVYLPEKGLSAVPAEAFFTARAVCILTPTASAICFAVERSLSADIRFGFGIVSGSFRGRSWRKLSALGARR